MIGQFRMLQRVKRLREDKALRALEKARAALREAEARRDMLAAEVEVSAASLPLREREVFETVLGSVVGMDRIEDAKQAVLQIHADHHRLEDRLARARDHVLRCVARLDEARRELRKRQQDNEKIDTVTDDLADTIAAEAAAREEIEVEDSFSRPRAAPGAVAAE